MQSGIRARSLKPPYDSLTLRAVVAELRQALIGGQIQNVRQPMATEVQLGIRSLGRNLLLNLSADAQYARAYLSDVRKANAPTPPNFCMTLRKHIENGRVIDVRQRGFDRILEIEVGGGEEAPTVTLIAELMGKHSNLILVNAEGTILDSAKRVSHRVNRVRETLPGLQYQLPPEQPDRTDPFLPDAVEKIVRELPQIPPNDPKALSEAMMQIFGGLSPFLAMELAVRALADLTGAEAGLRAAWAAIFGAAARGEYAPVCVSDIHGALIGAYPFPSAQVPVDRRRVVPNLNQALDETYRAIIERAGFEAVYSDLRGRLDREVKWLTRQQQMVQRALEEAAGAEAHKQDGELILANLWRIHTGDESAEVEDYFDPELRKRTLVLDPKRTPQENAELCFQRYRKARGSEAKERERGAETAANLAKLQAAQAELPHLATVEAVQSLRDELINAGLLRAGGEREEGGKRPAGPDFQGHKIRRYTTPEGYEIYLGETATANDFLTTRVASPSDIWLHVRAAASSHVVIRAKGHPDQVPRTVIQRAAELCALHSAQKHSSLVSVDFTLKRFVRKPRGSVPGAADYEKETTIDVTPSL